MTKTMMRASVKTILVFAVALMVFAAAQAVAAPTLKVKVKSVTGKAKYTTKPGGAWQDLRTGMTLEKKAELRVEKGGEVIIEWGQGHALKVYEMSEVRLDDISYDPQVKFENTIVNVKKGKVFAKSQKLLSKNSVFRVRTPTAVAAVRGTQFMVEVGQDNSSKIMLIEGKLEIAGELVQMVLQENTQILISAEAKSQPVPTTIPNDVKEQLNVESRSMDAPSQGSEQGQTPAPSQDKNDLNESIVTIVDDTINSMPDVATVEMNKEPDVPPLPPDR